MYIHLKQTSLRGQTDSLPPVIQSWYSTPIPYSLYIMQPSIPSNYLNEGLEAGVKCLWMSVQNIRHLWKRWKEESLVLVFPGLIVYRIYMAFNENMKTCPMCTRSFVPLFYLCALTGTHVVRILGSLALGSWLFDQNTIGFLMCVFWISIYQDIELGIFDPGNRTSGT